MKRADAVAILLMIAMVGAPALAVQSGAAQEWKKVSCATNLRSLWVACFKYANEYGTPKGDMQTETGSDFWLKLKRTPKPLIDKLDVYFCPLAGHDIAPDQTSFRGPISDVNKYGDRDPVGADLDGNHGAGKGGNVIAKQGDVREYKTDEKMWKAADSKLIGIPPVKKGQEKGEALEKRVADLERAVKELTELVKQLKEKLDKEPK